VGGRRSTLGGLPQDGDQTEDGLAGEPHADDVPQREDDRDALPQVGSWHSTREPLISRP